MRRRRWPTRPRSPSPSPYAAAGLTPPPHPPPGARALARSPAPCVAMLGFMSSPDKVSRLVRIPCTQAERAAWAARRRRQRRRRSAASLLQSGEEVRTRGEAIKKGAVCRCVDTANALPCFRQASVSGLGCSIARPELFRRRGCTRLLPNFGQVRGHAVLLNLDYAFRDSHG